MARCEMRFGTEGITIPSGDYVMTRLETCHTFADPRLELIVPSRGIALCTVGAMAQAESTCAICGSVTHDGLFPPGGAHHLEGPDGWVPLCHDHKAAFLRGQLPFPCWCEACRAWRPADHRHGDLARRSRQGRPA